MNFNRSFSGDVICDYDGTIIAHIKLKTCQGLERIGIKSKNMALDAIKVINACKMQSVKNRSLRKKMQHIKKQNKPSKT